MFCSYSCEEEIFFCDNVNDEQNYPTSSCKKMLEFHIIQPSLVLSPIILEIILMLAKALTQNNEAILVLFPCIVHKLMSPITLGIWSLPPAPVRLSALFFPKIKWSPRKRGETGVEEHRNILWALTQLVRYILFVALPFVFQASVDRLCI